MPRQTYKYEQDKSILNGMSNEYELSNTEFRILYMFFVTYSLCRNLSWQKKDLSFYGWEGSYKDTVKIEIDNVLRPDALVVVGRNKPENTLKNEMVRHDMGNGLLTNFDDERAVIVDKNEDNKFYNLCYHIRNCLAHGKFVLVYSRSNQKMIIFQDDDGNNVTGRMVLSLNTLLTWIKIIDKNGKLAKIMEDNDGSTNC